MNNQKVMNLATPTDNGDAVTKAYADALVTGIYSSEIKNTSNTNSKLTANQTELLNGTTPINMNGQTIIGLANAVSGTDALNRNTADGRYYLNTDTLDSLVAPIADLSLNS